MTFSTDTVSFGRVILIVKIKSLWSPDIVIFSVGKVILPSGFRTVSPTSKIIKMVKFFSSVDIQCGLIQQVRRSL